MDWREGDAARETRSRELIFGLLCQAAARKRWWIGLPLATLIFLGSVLCLQAPRYSAETQVLIGPRPGGLIDSGSSVAETGTAFSQAQLIASRDLARRAIKDLGLADNPEFDPLTRGLGPGFRALISLGIMRDPARKSPEDRVLEAYQDRLRVRGPGGGGVVTIAFQSEDPELAANAANRIAELYLEMRADAKHAADLPRRLDARIISRAVTPQHPHYPREALLVVSCAAILVMAFGAFVSIVLPRGEASARARAELPLEQPRTLGQVRVFAGFTDAVGLNPRLNSKLNPPPLARERETGGDDPDNGQAVTKIVARILSVSTRGPRGMRQGTRIVATSLEATGAASCVLLDLARGLARQGRSIVIGLDESILLDFETSTAGAPHGDSPGAEPALGDLLAGTASFAEVIRRDPASRLHFLPVGRGGELDRQEFAKMIDALAGIYDFVVTIAPPLERNGIATLAAKADVVLLATPEWPRSGAVFEAEARLIESGAREVLLLGVPAESLRIRGLDAA
jgi:Mrp family chromosome partitioning ATPase